MKNNLNCFGNIVKWLIECLTKGEVGEGGWEVMDWLVEEVQKLNGGESKRDGPRDC